MQFVCPDPVGTQGGLAPTQPDTNNRVMVVYGCPYRVYDGDNPFGNPSLAVHSGDIRKMAFATLHGQPDANGPSDAARKDETHTVFMTPDQGTTWYDEYTDPSFPKGAARGESSDIVMDDDGQIYVMLKWSMPGDGGWRGFLGLFKGGTADDPRSVKDSYLYGRYIQAEGHEFNPRYNPGGSVTDGGLVYIPDTGLPSIEDTRNETQEEEPQDGDAAVDYVPGDERVLLMWHEETVKNITSAEGWTGWIDAAWTGMDTSNQWDFIEPSERIGPCKDASRPIHYRGDAYIICTVAKGYDERPRARVGDHDVWRLDMKTGETELMGWTRLNGGEPQLTGTEDGYMVASSFQLETRGEEKILTPRMHFSYGWYGRAWSAGGNLGPFFHELAGNHDILDAHLTAVQVTEDRRTVFAIYQERLDEEQPEAPDFDPDDPTSVTPHLTDYRKIIVTFDECGNFPIAAAEFDLGGGMDAYNYNAYLQNPGIYNDHQDGLQVVRDVGTDEEVLYFAVNDYGAVQFGAVFVAQAGAQCISVPPLLPMAPAALPQALTLTSPASLVTGSVLALPLAGMVGYLLTVKRRTAQFVAAEDK